MGKIDEQISYNWLFFLLAGAFGAVTFWAVYDETATRREYKGYQETFFTLETTTSKKAWHEARAALEKSTGWQKATAELKRVEEQRRKTVAEEAAQRAKLQDLEFVAFDKQQNYTFTKSNLDEAYYYYTVAKHQLGPGTPKDSKASREYEERAKKLEKFQAQLAKDELAMNQSAAARDCVKKGHDKDLRPTCDALSAEEYAAGNYQSAGRPVAVDAYDQSVTAMQKKVDDLERPVKELERHYLAAKEKAGSGPAGLFGPATEIVQQDIAEMGRVDRCESCHMGSTKGGFETVLPKVFQTHPYRRTLLALHPPEKFGCTACHDGQGRATTKFYAHAPTEDHHDAEKHFWEYPLLEGPYMESECRQCHRQEVELRAYLKCETDVECPKLGSPPKDGAAAGSQSAGVQLKCGPLGLPINPSRDLDKQLDAKIEEGKWCGTPDANDDAKVDAVLVDLAPHLSRGRRIIDEAGCYGCHPIEGYEGRAKPGPDLRHAASKLNPGWMVEWIQNPKAFRPNTRMPNFFPERLHPEEYPESAKPKYVDGFAEIDKIGETNPQKRAEALELLPAEKFQPQQQALLMTSFLLGTSTPFAMPDEAAIPAGDEKRGEALVDGLGCYGCHNRTAPTEPDKIERVNRGSHFDHGPDLGNIGAKASRQWIYAWLKDPKKYAPQTRMPNLRLSDQEAADVATFLAGSKFVDGKPKDYPAVPLPVDQQKKDFEALGKKLVTYYGCFGCHAINGMETRAGVGVDLSEFGVKEVARLDYGDYIVSHSKQTWEAWLENKLKHPRVYRYERVDTRMPQFDFTAEEIQDVMVVLKGMRGKTRDDEARGHKLTPMEALREKGRDLVRFYDCQGCHSLDGKVGEIRSLPVYNGDSPDQGPRFAPPVLTGEGAKTQPPWLFSFLKSPSKLRPHLQVRMPTFGLPDSEATAIVAMFSAFDGADYPYHDNSGFKLEGERKVQAQGAFKAAQCTQCHTLGDTPTPEMAQKGAPNLLLAKNRLRGDWVARWIRDPQLLYQGVNMPSFFSSGNPLTGADQTPMMKDIPGIHELAKMEAPEVIYLLRDLLMTLEPASAGAPTTPPAKPAKKSAQAPVPGIQHAAR